MEFKPLVCGESLIEIERKRYDELLRKEESLRLITSALSRMDDYANIKELRTAFGIKKENKNE